MWPDLQLAVAVNVNRLVLEIPSQNDVRAAQLVTGLRLEAPPEAPERAATAEERRQLLGRYRAGRGTNTIEIAEENGELVYRSLRSVFPVRMVSANRLVVTRPGQPPVPVYVIREPDGRVRWLFNINAVVVKQP